LKPRKFVTPSRLPVLKHVSVKAGDPGVDSTDESRRESIAPELATPFQQRGDLKVSLSGVGRTGNPLCAFVCSSLNITLREGSLEPRFRFLDTPASHCVFGWSHLPGDEVPPGGISRPVTGGVPNAWPVWAHARTSVRRFWRRRRGQRFRIDTPGSPRR